MPKGQAQLSEAELFPRQATRAPRQLAHRFLCEFIGVTNTLYSASLILVDFENSETNNTYNID